MKNLIIASIIIASVILIAGCSTTTNSPNNQNTLGNDRSSLNDAESISQRFESYINTDDYSSALGLISNSLKQLSNLEDKKQYLSATFEGIKLKYKNVTKNGDNVYAYFNIQYGTVEKTAAIPLVYEESSYKINAIPMFTANVASILIPTGNGGYEIHDLSPSYVISGNTCSPQWQCSSWSECSSSSSQTRTCTAVNNCANSNGKPSETQSCVYNGCPDLTGLSFVKPNKNLSPYHFYSSDSTTKYDGIFLVPDRIVADWALISTLNLYVPSAIGCRLGSETGENANYYYCSA